jgi:hypothetical protein
MHAWVSIMGFNEESTLLAAAMAISTQVAAQAACDPAAGLTFICGLTNAHHGHQAEADGQRGGSPTI